MNSKREMAGTSPVQSASAVFRPAAPPTRAGSFKPANCSHGRISPRRCAGFQLVHLRGEILPWLQLAGLKDPARVGGAAGLKTAEADCTGDVPAISRFEFISH